MITTQHQEVVVILEGDSMTHFRIARLTDGRIQLHQLRDIGIFNKSVKFKGDRYMIPYQIKEDSHIFNIDVLLYLFSNTIRSQIFRDARFRNPIFQDLKRLVYNET